MDTRALPDRLTQVELAHHVFTAPSGFRFTVLERGARVLSACSPELAEDLFWINGAYADAASLAGLLDSDDGWNSGGDRTWLAPEIGLNMADYRRWDETYVVPAGVDPGDYEVQDAGPEHVTLAQEAEATDFRLDAALRLTIAKTVRLTPDPLAADGGAPEGVCYGGYQLETTLGPAEPLPEGAAVGLWGLLQVPAGGRILIPTVGAGRVTDYFEPTGPTHLKLAGDHVAFTIDGQSRHKIALRAAWHWGRLGYLRRVDAHRSALIVRNFANNPSARYVDVPVADLADETYSIQCYNDGGSYGGFGEMEYHAPAISAAGPASYTDVSQQWCYVGPKDGVAEVATRLLGIENA